MRSSHRLRTIAVALALLVASASFVMPGAQASTPCSAPSAQAAAQKYLDALTDRNAAWTIPFHPRVVRFENGLPTGIGALELRLDLYLHLQLSVMQGVRDLVWTYQPAGRVNVINATYNTPVGLPGLIVGGSTIVEDFTVTPACKIWRIDATFTVDPPA